MAPSRRELLQGVARLSGGLALAPVLAAMGAESAVAVESLSSELNVCRPLGDSLTALQQGNARFAAAWTAAARVLNCPAETAVSTMSRLSAAWAFTRRAQAPRTRVSIFFMSRYCWVFV